MANSNDAHIVVEIPVDEEHQQQKVSSAANKSISAMQNHPLMEISGSPGHLLLLKLWQREEDLFGRRISMKETRMDSIKTEMFQLCYFFFIFHGFFLTILFNSSVNSENPNHQHGGACRSWWIPSILSASTSLAIIFLVQIKLCRYWKVSRQLQRERVDGRALTRCIQELRMKGASFDLSKEPQIGKRMKSSSVEIKWKPLTWVALPGFQINPLCCLERLWKRSFAGNGKQEFSCLVVCLFGRGNKKRCKMVEGIPQTNQILEASKLEQWGSDKSDGDEAFWSDLASIQLMDLHIIGRN